jgi:hypothetical protein
MVSSGLVIKKQASAGGDPHQKSQFLGFEIVPADGNRAANWKKRRLRYVTVLGQLSVKAIA